MKDAITLDAGEIVITLDRIEYRLVPTLGALKAISQKFNGLLHAFNQAQLMDADAIIFIIQQGLSKDVQIDDLPNAIYRTGIANLDKVCTDYINVLGNGGRPLSAQSSKTEKSSKGKP